MKDRSHRGRYWRWIGRGVSACIVLVLLAAALLWAALRGSFPRDTGTLRLAGLAAPVTVARDAWAVPLIAGESLEDVARAQGFVHAQERFFQMDLARRAAAGEVAALMGPGAVQIDREARPLRFRAVARDVVQRLPERHRRLLGAYAAGVNAGLRDLAVRPPEYMLLRIAPEPWHEEDSLLAVFLMFRFLNYTSDSERSVGVMRDALPEELVRFLTPDASRFDAPVVVRDPSADRAAASPAPIPGPEVLDLRRPAAAPSRTGPSAAAPAVRDSLFALFGASPDGASLGSNNWAVAGSRTSHGGAIVANDMHLTLSAPNIWFRNELRWQGGRLIGVSLPGVPGIVCGSNGAVAWGFTNVEADVQDLIVVETDPADPTRYRTPEGWESFSEHRETIAINGREPETLPLRATRWGVVTGTDHRGRPLVLRWTALDAEKVNLRLLDMADATTLEDALRVARESCIPPQNVLIADASGRIGYTVSGWLPRRVGDPTYDGAVPWSWADGAGWAGQIDDADRPLVVDPPEGLLWTANNRTVGLPEARFYGRAWSPPVRAQRIRELLRARQTWDEAGLLALGLDARSATHDIFRDIVLEIVPQNEPDGALHEARALASSWDGTAGVDQAGYRLLRAFAAQLRRAVFEPILAPCVAADKTFRYNWPMSDEPLMRLLEERPPHLLPPAANDEYNDWTGFLRAQLRAGVDRMRSAKPPSFGKPWGDFMRVRAQHPISRGVPRLGRLLDLPTVSLPGDAGTVRAQGQSFGASERFAVSPGRETSAVFHMPGGQSGHFLSPHYTDGHGAWVRGDPTPMLPGEARKTLTLTP